MIEFGRTHEGALDPEKLAHALETLGADWADKNAAAEVLERLDKPTLAQITNQIRGETSDRRMTRKEAEDQALASPEYLEHLRARTEARRVANIARANFDAVKVRIEAMRTVEATKRAELSAYRGR